MKPKFGIVSSFDVLCGNATYSEAIANGLSEGFEVSRIDVPVYLQKNYDSVLLKQVIRNIKECEYINIQMELALYGPTPSTAFRALRHIIKSCENFSVTLHRIDEPPKSLTRQIFNSIKSGKFRDSVNAAIFWCKDHLVANTYVKLVREVVSRGGVFIVHTEREKRRIEKINERAKVKVYPILWPTVPQDVVDLRGKFKNDNPIVGLFGFVTPYKNYEIVAEGLAAQPFNILIAGGVHPQSPSYGKNSSNISLSYIRRISNFFSRKEYNGRVFFFTSPSDAELIQLVQSVDIVCVPYLETGQSGSGIASMAIQYGRKVVFSDNACTRELLRFLNRAPILFDVDSPLGLACAISSVNESAERVEFVGYDFSGLLDLYKKASGCHT